MNRIIIVTIVSFILMSYSLLFASQINVITDFNIIKVQGDGVKSGQFTLISKQFDGWAKFSTKNKSGFAKTMEYFNKLPLDKSAIIYMVGDHVVGVKSGKFGNFGHLPKSQTLDSKGYVGTVTGCEMHQGMVCGLLVGNTNFSIVESTTSREILDTLYPKTNIGRKVKVTGAKEKKFGQNYLIVKTIEFLN